MKENTGVITKLESKLIIKMHNIEYFISIIEIKKKLEGDKFRSEIKNKENIEVGSFYIANNQKTINFVIGSVTFTSDLEDLKKLIDNQLFEVSIYRTMPKSPAQAIYRQKFNSRPYQQKSTIIRKKNEIPLNSSFRNELIAKFNITKLWHFTHLENLESILKNGLFLERERRSQAITRPR